MTDRLSGKKIALDVDKKYIKEFADLQTNEEEICMTVRYTPEENGRSERMSRTIKHAIRTMLKHLGVPANL